MKRHPIPGETDGTVYFVFIGAATAASAIAAIGIFVYGGLTLALLAGWL